MNPIIDTAYGRHCIEDDDIESVVKVLKSDYLSGGPVLEEFESEFAKKLGVRFAVSCSSGTAGLHMASLAMGLKMDCKVVVPTMTFLATANAPRFTGADVVFADVDRETGLMGPEHLEEAINRAGDNVSAVFLVHMNGQAVDMRAISDICRRRGIKIVEDACHALGGEYLDESGTWHKVGSCSHSDIAVFSLHPVKSITMGEGGVVTTNDENLYHAIRLLRNHGMTRDPHMFEDCEAAFDAHFTPNLWYYEMRDLGYNYRPSAINCALGLSQLKKLNRFIIHRSELANKYDKFFTSKAPLIRPIPRLNYCKHSWHLYVVHINYDMLGITRNDLIRRLQGKGVGSQVHYRPVHQQPYYRKKDDKLKLEGASAYYQSCLSLPISPVIPFDKKEIHWLCVIDEILNEY